MSALESTTLDPDARRIPQWTLGDRLKKSRLTADLEQKDVADKLGYTRQMVSNWEHERSAPTAAVIIELARLYSVDIAWLLEGDRAVRAASASTSRYASEPNISRYAHLRKSAIRGVRVTATGSPLIAVG